MNLGIVAIGYNRVDCLKRLLRSLQECAYEHDEVTLIISIDKWITDEVVRCAEDFQWQYGEKIVKTFPERLGLQQHILKCGGYMQEYDLDAIAVFEDDIVPSVEFYLFMRQAVAFYAQDDRVAGIGLYSYQRHPVANRPFSPMLGKGSVYLNRYAVSWGQIWMKKQWADFVEWYQKVDDQKIQQIDIPQAVKQWKNSWLKYHIAYCCDQRKYFVYPYKSLTTCYAEQGEHTSLRNHVWQTPIVEEPRDSYHFLPLDEITVRYDSFFENEYLEHRLWERGYNTCVDLYGLKGEDIEKEFWLTGEAAPYEAVASYDLVLKPHEKNILCNVDGMEIFLYDRNKPSVPKRQHFSMNKFLYYFNGSIDKRFLLYHVKRVCRDKIRRRFRGRK